MPKQLKAYRPHPRDYPRMPPDYRHTDKAPGNDHPLYLLQIITPNLLLYYFITNLLLQIRG